MRKFISVIVALVICLSTFLILPITTSANEEPTMYVDYNATTNQLQVVQKYSDTEDFVMVMKPLSPNGIFNIAPPKVIDDSSEAISNNVANAVQMVGMAESDWIGPYFDGSYWYGGTHSNDGAATGRSDNIVLKLDGSTVSDDTGVYANTLEISWTNHLFSAGTTDDKIVENVVVSFDGDTWSVSNEISFVKDTKLKSYYGMQCVYGPWNDKIYYGDGAIGDITDGRAATSSNTRLCDTMLLTKNEHRLEMKLDRTYGMGIGEYQASDSHGAFSNAYGSSENGKAYFTLVSDANGVAIPAGTKTGWRGTYRFYAAGTVDKDAVKNAISNYVISQKNNINYQGILGAARMVDPTVTINESDCYIKYSVPGVSDNDAISGYKLDIPGSDGAVSVTVSIGESSFTEVFPFAHEKEVLDVDCVAIAGADDNLLYYNDAGNVIGCADGVDKIVISESFAGTIGVPDFTTYPAMSKVESVIIHNNTTNMVESAINADWTSLKALSINAGNSYYWSGKKNFMTHAKINGCEQLKYIALPNALDNDWFNNYSFCNLPALENVNIPFAATYFWGSFKKTGVKEYRLGGTNYYRRWLTATSQDTSNCFAGGDTMRVINSTDEITFLQATAIIAAEINNNFNSGLENYTVISDNRLMDLAWSEASYNYLKNINTTFEADSKGNIITKLSVEDNVAGITGIGANHDEFSSKVKILKNELQKYAGISKNNFNSGSLLAELKKALPNDDIKISDFYIKYAVPGVSDNDTVSGYPLTIDGSDGAVSVSVNVNGTAVNLTAPFAHEKEVLDVDCVAIAGADDNLLYYNDAGNVIGCADGVDKIVISESFAGTIGVPDFTKYPAMSKVESVIIHNNTTNMVESAINADWTSLKALSINAGNSYYWSGKKNFMTHAKINGCEQLKYIALPNALDNDWFNNYSFCNLPALENVNIPFAATYFWGSFKKTGVKEYRLGGTNYYRRWLTATSQDTSNCFAGGDTMRVINSTDEITFLQATAIIAAEINNNFNSGLENYTVISDNRLMDLAWSEASYNYLKSIYISADNSIEGEVSISYSDGDQSSSTLITSKKVDFYVYDLNNRIKIKINTKDIQNGITTKIKFANSNIKYLSAEINDGIEDEISLTENTVNVSLKGTNEGDWAILNFSKTNSSGFDFEVSNCEIDLAANNFTSFTTANVLIYLDANGDKQVNITDLVRLKKYFVALNDIQIDEEAVLGDSDEITSGKLVELRKLLMGSYKVSLKTQDNSDSLEKPIVRTAAQELGLTQEILEKTLLNKGNMSRIANVIKKAERGEAVTIGAIGGSITEGTAASTNSTKYFERFCDWWETTFPDSTLTRVNVGKGATDSLMGVHRVDNDLLSQNPDLVIVDFTVNDPYNALYADSYEGLIRKILKDENNPALIMLMMVKQDGTNAAEYHVPVGSYYDLPIVNYKEAIKNYSWSEISPDTIHPNDTGHAIASESLIYCIETVRTNIDKISDKIESLPTPITDNSYENGIWYNSTNLSATALGSFAVDPNAYQFRNGWSYTGSGNESLVFNVDNAKNIYVLFKSSTSSNAGTATISVDGGTTGILNGVANGFNATKSYAALNDITAGKHTITITPASGSEFTVIGILVS